jgi:peptidoglycan hydrolase CwlO-like protein
MSPEEREKKEKKKMPFIVANYVYASSQGQRTHSARTNSVRDSSLNFSLKETPYSLYLTIRKTFSKASLSSEQNSTLSLPSLVSDQTQKEINTLKQKLEYVQESNERLKSDLTEAVDECEQCHVQIKNLESTIDEMKKILMKKISRKWLVNLNSKMNILLN